MRRIGWSYYLFQHVAESWDYCRECQNFNVCLLKPTLACSLKVITNG